MADNKLPDRDDAKSGELTYTAEYLHKHPAKVKELLAAPDGTPGKDVALRVSAAAPIITAAVKDAKEWDKLHGKAALVTKALAGKLARLRTLYPNSEGFPDMRGTSAEYREAANQIYVRAGFDESKVKHIQGAVRFHVSDEVRKILRGPEFADGDEAKYRELCARYKLNPTSLSERQKIAQSNTRLPALRVAEDDVVAMFRGAATYAHKALEVPRDVDPSALPEEDREALRSELEAVQALATQWLEKLGDD
jgi:hypothetical protein